MSDMYSRDKGYVWSERHDITVPTVVNGFFLVAHTEVTFFGGTYGMGTSPKKRGEGSMRGGRKIPSPSQWHSWIGGRKRGGGGEDYVGNEGGKKGDGNIGSYYMNTFLA